MDDNINKQLYLAATLRGFPMSAPPEARLSSPHSPSVPRLLLHGLRYHRHPNSQYSPDPILSAHSSQVYVVHAGTLSLAYLAF